MSVDASAHVDIEAGSIRDVIDQLEWVAEEQKNMLDEQREKIENGRIRDEKKEQVRVKQWKAYIQTTKELRLTLEALADRQTQRMMDELGEPNGR